MIRDLMIGQYYETGSVIHRLDPRMKLAGTMLYIISLFTFRNFYAYAVVTAFLLSVIVLAKIPFKVLFRGMKPIIMLLVITVFFNLFLLSGETILWKWGILKITTEGIQSAVFLGMRLIYLILGSSILTYTTTPNHLTDGLERSLHWMTHIKVPVHEVAMMMSLALRFIPILLEELDKIMKAQQARGAVFDQGNIIKRLKSLLPVLIPLFISAFRRADELANAMEARCYTGGEGRTKMKPLKYHGRDAVGYLMVAAYLAVVILVGRL